MSPFKRRLLSTAAPHFLIMASLNQAIRDKAKRMNELHNQHDAITVTGETLEMKTAAPA